MENQEKRRFFIGKGEKKFWAGNSQIVMPWTLDDTETEQNHFYNLIRKYQKHNKNKKVFAIEADILINISGMTIR